MSQTEQFGISHRPEQAGTEAIASVIPLPRVSPESLPSYPVKVIRRKEHLPAVETSDGTFLQHTVRYSDGAVRLATIGLPHTPVSPYPIVASDAWYTSASGFNRYEIERAVANGFPIVWNHHQGRHAVTWSNPERKHTLRQFAANKSLYKTAAQDHALLDSLAEAYDFDAYHVIRRGYSRGAMSGEAFIAQCELPGVQRQTLWSDMEGACFAKSVGLLAFSRGVVHQLPAELETIAEIGIGLMRKEFGHQPVPRPTLRKILGTLDLHPVNQIHETAWLRLLINGEAGLYAQAIPANAKGVRTIYTDDYSGQASEWEKVHARRPGMVILRESGAHLAGATLRMLLKKERRMQRLARYIWEHDADLTEMTANDIIDKPIF